MRIEIAPVTPANWPSLAALFEAPGGPGYCWCTAWREVADRAQASPLDRKAVLAAQVAAGVPVGLLLTADDQPGGWCALGPARSLRRLKPGPAEAGLWAVTCFFLRRDLRGSGLSKRLLQAAVHEARRNGATALEGYPVDPDAPSYRFMGFTPLFAGQGFGETGRAGSRRHVMRLALQGGMVGGDGLEPPTFSV